MFEPDAKLLERWMETRDADAFRELVERYSGLVFATARRILRRVEATEDVTQECFLKLAGSSPPREMSLGAWLHRVATNLSISVLRSERARKRAEERWREIADRGERSWEEIEPLIDEAIEALPPAQRI
ncbi:MAG TPA: sigma-70 family RNA polymerase sigma factor, partial [Planctomycetota bacterium]|nr:sigma-70 family RNA polymerase sigma factor [Planctomycetota bacterium]